LSETHQIFLQESAAKTGDLAMQLKLSSAARQYKKSFEEAVTQFSNLETAKRRVAFTRWKALENLDKYLIEFEANFIRSGGKVLWAQDAAEACAEIMAIVNRSANKNIVKAKTLTSEEIGLDEEFASHSQEWTETDLGQMILQLSGEKPMHMVMPAIHKDKKEVQQLFNDKLGSKVEDDTEALVSYASKVLRTKYMNSGIGITGANFIVADPGAIAFTENEGNVLLAASRTRIHIVIAGIDKVIPSINDLHTLLPVLSTYGTGQKLTAYNTILTGPRKTGETDGPDEMYVVLIDNGRSKVLGEELQRKMLSCIRCGACQYHDPVYSVIGAHPYHSTWMGPPATVVLPYVKGFKSHGFFSDLSTLSAADTEGCPVEIDFNKLLLDNRKKAVDEQSRPGTEKLFYFAWKKAMLKREIIKWASIKPRNFFMNAIFMKSPLGLRKMRPPAKESFNEQWRRRFT